MFARFIPVPPPPPSGAILTIRTAGAGTVHSAPAGIDCPGSCAAKFRVGQIVLLTASPGQGSTFKAWSGDCAGVGQCRLDMAANHSVSAAFSVPTLMVSVSGAGRVISQPAGVDCPVGSCRSSFPSGTSVTLMPHPGPGSKFVGWTGDCKGTGRCTLRMNADHLAGAEFSGVSMPTLSVSTAGSGTGTVVSADHKIDCGSTCSASFLEGSVVALTALPSSDSTFAGWSGGGCSGAAPVCKVAIGSTQNVTASFSASSPLRDKLTISVTGAASGTVTSADGEIDCSSMCSASYPAGSVVTLTETPSSGATSGGWSGGGCSGTGPSCAVTMNANQAVTLAFNAAPPTNYALTVDNPGPGYGAVMSSDGKILCRRVSLIPVASNCSATYTSGAIVALTAAPAKGDTFTGWSGGGCSGTGATCSVTMSGSQTVTATFGVVASTSYLLTVQRTGSGSGIVVAPAGQISCGVMCSHSYPAGATVLLVEKPHGSTFEGWSGGGCSGALASCQVSMTSNETVTASFSLNYSLSVTVMLDGEPPPSPSPVTVSTADGKIDCPTRCYGSYASGTMVQLTASPSSGQSFGGWSGDCSGTTTTCTLTMSKHDDVTASFNTVFH